MNAPDAKGGVTITAGALWTLLGVTAIGVGGYAARDFILEHVPLPWENECDRLDRRCRLAMQSGSDLGGAIVCGMTGLLTVGRRTEEACAYANRTLDDQREGRAPKDDPTGHASRDGSPSLPALDASIVAGPGDDGVTLIITSTPASGVELLLIPP